MSFLNGGEDDEYKRLKKLSQHQDVTIENLRSQQHAWQTDIAALRASKAELAAQLIDERERNMTLERTCSRAKADKDKAVLQVANLEAALENSKRSEAETSKGRRRGDIECEIQVERVQGEKMLLEEKIKSLETALNAKSQEVTRLLESQAGEQPASHRTLALENQVRALEQERDRWAASTSKLQSGESLVRRRAPRRSSLSGPTPALDFSEAAALRKELEATQTQLQAAHDGAAKSKAEAFKATNELMAAQRIADRESREARDALDELRDELRWAQAERDELRKELDTPSSSSGSSKLFNELQAKLQESVKRIEELSSALEQAQRNPAHVSEASKVLQARVDELEAMLQDKVVTSETTTAHVVLLQARIAEMEEEERQLQATAETPDSIEAQLTEAKNQLSQAQGGFKAKVTEQGLAQAREHNVTLDGLRADLAERDDNLNDVLTALHKREQELSSARHYLQRLSSAVQRKFRSDNSLTGDESTANTTLSDISTITPDDSTARAFETDLLDEIDQFRQHIDEASTRFDFQRVEASLRTASLERNCTSSIDSTAAITFAATLSRLDLKRHRLRAIESRHEAMQRVAAQVPETTARVELLEKRLAAYDRETRSWSAQVQEGEEQLLWCRRRIDELEACLAEPAASIATLLTDKAELEARVARRTAQISEHQGELKAERMNRNLAQDAAEDLIREKGEMAKQLQKLNADLLDAHASRDAAPESSDALVVELEERRQQLAQLDKELYALRETQQSTQSTQTSTNDGERSSDEALFEELASKTRTHAVLTAQLAETREACNKAEHALVLSSRQVLQLRADTVSHTEQLQAANHARHVAVLRVAELEKQSIAQTAAHDQALSSAQARLLAAQEELKVASERIGSHVQELHTTHAMLAQERELRAKVQEMASAAEAALEESQRVAVDMQVELDSLSPLREQVSSLTERVARAEQDYCAAVQEADVLKQSLDSGSSESLEKIGELTASLEISQSRIEELTGIISENEDRIEQLNSQRGQLMRQFNKRDGEFWEIKEELATSQEESERLAESLAVQETVVAARDRALLELQTANQEYEQQLESAARVVDESHSRYCIAELELSKSKSALDKATQQAHALQMEQERLTSTLDALAAEKAAVAIVLNHDESGGLPALKARIEQLEEELSVKAMEAEDHDTKMFEQLKEMKKLQLRNRRLQARLDELQPSSHATASGLAGPTQATPPSGISTAALTTASTPGTSRKRSAPEVDDNSLPAAPPTRAIYVSPRKTFTPVRRLKSNNIASSFSAHAAATGSQLFPSSDATSIQQRTVSNPSALIQQGLVTSKSVSGLVDRTNTPRSVSNEGQANIALNSSKRSTVPAPPIVAERKAVGHIDLMKRLQTLNGLRPAPKV